MKLSIYKTRHYSSDASFYLSIFMLTLFIFKTLQYIACMCLCIFRNLKPNKKIYKVFSKKTHHCSIPNPFQSQREGFRVIDNRPKSLVTVEGSNVQALYNYLLNCRTCTANSGVQAGLPPTILSPKPFKGATLKSHKVGRLNSVE